MSKTIRIYFGFLKYMLPKTKIFPLHKENFQCATVLQYRTWETHTKLVFIVGKVNFTCSTVK